MSSPTLGNVVFDLTFFYEVSMQYEIIKGIHEQVLDSCIAFIVCWPIIRVNHLVQEVQVIVEHKSCFCFIPTKHEGGQRGPPARPLLPSLSTTHQSSIV